MKRLSFNDLKVWLVLIIGVIWLQGFSPLYSQLADSPWPKHMGPSLHNTGRSPYAGPDSPQIKWSFDLGDETHFRTPAIDPNGTIYVGSSEQLFALNPDGSTKWSVYITYEMLNHVTISEANFLYIQSSYHKMYKIDGSSGTLVNDNWPYDFSPFYYTNGVYPATIANDGTILCGTGGRPYGYLHAINPDGTEKWKVANIDNVETLPAIDEVNKVVYAGNHNNQVMKVNLENGNIIKQVQLSPVSQGYINSHIAIGDNGLIYFTKFVNVGDNKGYIYAYDSELNEKWRTQLGTYWVIPPAIGHDGTIYTAGRNTGKLTALAPFTGIKKWSLSLDSDTNTPPVIDANGTVYVVTKNFLYAIIPYETYAQIKWTFQLDGSGYPQPAIGGDGTLYILTTNGILTALGKVNKPPTANAGEDITITSKDVSNTIIHGTASDEDPNDKLEYRWKKDEAVLMDWTPVGENGESPLYLSSIPLGIGGYSLTLEVSDGEDTSTDDMILVIKNSSPYVTPGGGGVYEINTEVILGGHASDFDGDLLSYKWIEGTNVLYSGAIQAINGGTLVELPNHYVSTLPLGMHTIILRVDDGVNEPVYGEIVVEIVDTTPPILAPTANKTVLWPPNHKMVDIVIGANVSDNGGLPVSLSASISSNEPVSGMGDGDQSPDWTEPVIDQENGIVTFQLRAERSGTGNGRIYTIRITAIDTTNNSTAVDILITVPHNNSNK